MHLKLLLSKSVCTQKPLAKQSGNSDCGLYAIA